VPPALEEAAAGALDRLGDLDKHLARAREALARALPELGDDAAGERPPPLRALDTAHAALAALGAYVGGLHREVAGGGAIELVRDGRRVTVVVPDTATPAELAAFAAELGRIDERLLGAARLIGLIAGLGAQWVAAGFAPPMVLQTLAERDRASWRSARRSRGPS
jgi:hypothetical protein